MSWELLLDTLELLGRALRHCSMHYCFDALEHCSMHWRYCGYVLTLVEALDMLQQNYWMSRWRSWNRHWLNKLKPAG